MAHGYTPRICEAEKDKREDGRFHIIISYRARSCFQTKPNQTKLNQTKRAKYTMEYQSMLPGKETQPFPIVDKPCPHAK